MQNEIRMTNTSYTVYAEHELKIQLGAQKVK